MASATLEMAGYEIRGTYQGGPYIDLHFGQQKQAFDVINVFDYENDRPTIPNTSEAILQELREWRDSAGDSLEHDLREHAFAVYGWP